MHEIISFSDADLAKIRAAVRYEFERRRNTTDRQGDNHPDHQEGSAPAVYVVKTPSGGIPAAEVSGDTLNLGTAECTVYQVVRDLREPDPFVEEVLSNTVTVHNVSLLPVGGDTWVIVRREGYGAWVVSEGSGEAGGGPGFVTRYPPAVGTGTGTGTGQGEPGYPQVESTETYFYAVPNWDEDTPYFFIQNFENFAGTTPPSPGYLIQYVPGGHNNPTPFFTQLWTTDEGTPDTYFYQITVGDPDDPSDQSLTNTYLIQYGDPASNVPPSYSDTYLIQTPGSTTEFREVLSPESYLIQMTTGAATGTGTGDGATGSFEMRPDGAGGFELFGINLTLAGSLLDGIGGGGDTEGTLAALGSTQGDAAAITETATTVTGADGVKGVRLPNSAGPRVVWNDSASNLKVYPNSGAQIQNGGTNAHANHAGFSIILYWRVSSTQWGAVDMGASV